MLITGVTIFIYRSFPRKRLLPKYRIQLAYWHDSSRVRPIPEFTDTTDTDTLDLDRYRYRVPIPIPVVTAQRA